MAITWLAGYWIRQAEIISLACQITEAVPSIPGLTALLVFMLLNPFLLRVSRRLSLSRAEIVILYMFTTVATTMFGCGVVRFLIACISVPYYYSTAAAPLDQLAPNIPSWLSPTSFVLHRWLYESSPAGTVPWGAWLVPMFAWTGFFVLFGGALMALMLLVSEEWIDHERLVFPIVRLPVEMLEGSSGTSFFRQRAAWIGMGAAALLNAINMVRGVFFGGPSGGLRVDLGRQLVDYPWRALRPLQANLRPELIGLGYLVSTELSFSIWFFYVFHKLQSLLLTMAGYRLSGLPFAQEQGIGAYLVLGLILLWKGRRALTTAWHQWTHANTRQTGRVPYRWALAGAIACLAGLVLFMVAAGMAPWLAILYLTILVVVACVYARVRAETGVPLVWAFPYGQQHKVIWNFLGQARVIGIGPTLASPTIFALMAFLSRGYFPTVSGYEIEGLRLGQLTALSWPHTAWTMLVAVAFGALSAMVFHLQPYYHFGGVGLRGGIWGSGIARQEYLNVIRGAAYPAPPDVPRIIATCFGGGLVALLAGARSYWFSFPFHPVGYAVACAYGNLVWAPFLIVWIVKSALLHYGGSQSYLRALPGFVGFALGHFITAGAIWGSLAAALGGPFLRWGVWFG